MKKCLFFIFAMFLIPAFAFGQNHPNSEPISRIQETPLVYPFSFVVMGDTRTPGQAIFAQLREQIALLDPPPIFVINAGDLVYAGFDFEYLAYIEAIDDYELPFISVIGNHEMYVPGGLNNYRNYFGPDDFYFDYNPCRFISLNNSNPYSGYGLSNTRLNLLEDWLTPESPVLKFTFLHVPPDFDNFDQYAQLVESEYPIPIAFFGHLHRYETWIRNDLRYVITGGGGAEIGWPREEDPPNYGLFHHFLLVTVYPEGIITSEVIKQGWGTDSDPLYDFEVVLDPDPIPPVVDYVSPEPLTDDVSVSTQIIVEFDEAMDQEITEGAISLDPPAAAGFSWNGNQLILTPDELLAPGEKYTVTISFSASDEAGNTLDGNRDGQGGDQYSWSFTTTGEPVDDDDDNDDDDTGDDDSIDDDDDDDGCGC